MRKMFFAAIISLCIVSSVSPQNISTISDAETIINLKANLGFLASDELEGRNTGSRSEKIASKFIAAELMKYGVKPFGDDGTYFQNFDLKVRQIEDEPNFSLINKSGKVINELKPDSEIIIDDSFIRDEKYLGKPAELIFAGFGITAEEYDYDDYRNIDVKGKIVIYLSGEPAGNDEDFFKGSEQTRYSSPAFKYQLAAEKGAVGVLSIVSDSFLPYWNLYWSLTMIGEFKFTEDEFTPPGGIPSGLLNLSGLKKIMSDEKYSYEQVLEMRNLNTVPVSFEIDKKFSFDYKVCEGVKTVRNVVGIIEGNDPELKNEFVVLTAHYDHVDIYDGDVCNGANDNGSGTVAIMEIAKRFAEKQNNNRSIVVALVTGEEKGLLGAYNFTREFEHIDNVVADLNIDMCSRGDIDKLCIIGADRTSSELADIADIANKETVNFELDTSLSFTRSFQMSDHYPFALKKIPAFFLFDNYLEGLHGPKDEIQFVNFNKLLKTVKFAEKVTEKIANLEHRLVFDGEFAEQH